MSNARTTGVNYHRVPPKVENCARRTSKPTEIRRREPQTIPNLRHCEPPLIQNHRRDPPSNENRRENEWQHFDGKGRHQNFVNQAPGPNRGNNNRGSVRGESSEGGTWRHDKH